MINDAWHFAPWADVLYAPDAQWWRWQKDRRVRSEDLPAVKFSLQPDARLFYPAVRVLRYSGEIGIEWEPGTIRTGRHSGYAVINLAAQTRPKRVVLLGYDVQSSADGQHHAGPDYPIHSARVATRYESWLPMYDHTVAHLAERGISIVNASRETAITQIPRMSLVDALV